MKYKVTIEESISQTFEIEAESEEQAAEIAEGMYRNCEIVLDDSCVVERQMSVNDGDWREF